MAPRELISAVHSRIRLHRRLNLALTLAAPALLVSLAAILFFFRVVPHVVGIIFCLGVSGVVGGLLYRYRNLFTRISPSDAAALLDQKTHGKERFITLATVPADEMPELVRFIEQQCVPLGEQFQIEREIPFQLSQAARYSSLASPFVVAALIGTIMFGSSLRKTLQPAEVITAEQHKEELEALLQSSPDLPSAVRSELEALAQKLEAEGALSPELLDATEQAEETINEAAKAAQDDEQLTKNVDEPAEPALKQHEQQPPPAENQKASQQEKSAENPERPDQNKQPDEKKNAGENSKPGNDTARQENDKGQPSGEKKEGEQKQEGNSSAKENEKQGADKKEGSGLGDGGKGGKSSDKQMSEGEKQSGDNAQGAKKGNAENDSQQQGSGKEQANKQGQSGSSGANQEKQSSQQAQPSNEAGQQERKKDSLQRAKEAVGALKSDLERQAQQKPESSSEQQQSANQSANSQGDGKAPGQGKQQSKQENTNPEGKQQGPAEKQSLGEKQKGESDKKSESEKSESKQGDSSAKTPSERSASQSRAPEGEEQGERPSNQGEDRSQRPQKSANAPETVTRPGEESPDGKLSPIPGETRVKVEVPREDKILVRGEGREEAKRYANPNEAKAQTAIETTQFEKPKTETSRVKQPIPVEYQDLFE